MKSDIAVKADVSTKVDKKVYKVAENVSNVIPKEEFVSKPVISPDPVKQGKIVKVDKCPVNGAIINTGKGILRVNYLPEGKSFEDSATHVITFEDKTIEVYRDGKWRQTGWVLEKYQPINRDYAYLLIE